jgi:hypothetical protein
VSGLATEGGGSTVTFANRAENASGAVIESSDLSEESTDREIAYCSGIEPEAVESAI